MNSDLKYINAFNSIPGIGISTLRSLKEKFGTIENGWKAGDTEIERATTDHAANRIKWKRSSINPDKKMAELLANNIWMVCEDDNNFPKYLKEISHSPIAIYGKGNPSLLNTQDDKPCVAVVGTRKPTQYGLEACESIVRELASFEITIVSGMALGIDSRAHQTALDTGGKTIAVLGSGLDKNSIYPQENKGLAQRIIDSGGLLISEYTAGTPPMKEHFPQRNRIVSGLARGILVVEAKEKSGALITAKLGLEQNREIFAVPGSIFAYNSKGTNKLIQKGAKLVNEANDILEELGIEYTSSKSKNLGVLDEKEWILLQMLEEPLGIDMLKRKTGFETAKIISTLSLLELKGLVKKMEQDTYQKLI